MADKSIIDRVNKLRERLNDANYRYYVLAEPTIDDYEYDMLMNELIKFEKQHPEIITPDSPSLRVGGEPTKSFPAVAHEVPYAIAF